MKTLKINDDAGLITKALENLVSNIPQTNEPAAVEPRKRAKELARITTIKAAGISAALAIPPGPLGLATIIPDLIAIWKLQQSMVASIAATYGKSVYLQKETMCYCILKHGSATVLRELVVRTGQRYLIQQASIRTIQKILQKFGVRIAQRVIGRGVSRWIPLIGALGVGAYAYYDTTQVANTAIDLFSNELEFDKGLVS